MRAWNCRGNGKDTHRLSIPPLEIVMTQLDAISCCRLNTRRRSWVGILASQSVPAIRRASMTEVSPRKSTTTTSRLCLGNGRIRILVERFAAKTSRRHCRLVILGERRLHLPSNQPATNQTNSMRQRATLSGMQPFY